jgi:peptidoglycan/LPS O-acetylase OafA/YrhL
MVAIQFGTASWPVIRRAGRFGDFSYGLYIYAFPVQQTLIWLTGNKLSLAGGLAASFAVTALLAVMSWQFVEQPALRLKPRPGPVGSPFRLSLSR